MGTSKIIQTGQGDFWVSVPKYGENGEKFGKYWWKSPKKINNNNRLRKKPNLLNAQDLKITQGGLFSKNNKQSLSVYYMVYVDCRIVLPQKNELSKI